MILFEIVSLRATTHGYMLRQTEYPLMGLNEAEAVVAELNHDAIERKMWDRWTIIPADHYGRPLSMERLEGT